MIDQEAKKIITFEAALNLAQQKLKNIPYVFEKNLVLVESELLIIGAYRKATGSHLSRLGLFSGLKDLFPQSAFQVLVEFLEARSQGVPVQYVLGYQVFLEHEYRVAPGVLIPRPETEILASEAIASLKQFFQAEGPGAVPKQGLEIGLGSGILSIELLSAFEDLKMWSSEYSDAAKAIAFENFKAILPAAEVTRLSILSSKDPLHVFEPFRDPNAASRAASPLKVDFIISNPPYLIESADEVENEVKQFEPVEALFPASEDPLYFYKKIAVEGRSFLKEKGFIFLEVPHERAEIILGLFSDLEWDRKLVLDLTGRKRVLVVRIR